MKSYKGKRDTAGEEERYGMRDTEGGEAGEEERQRRRVYKGGGKTRYDERQDTSEEERLGMKREKER